MPTPPLQQKLTAEVIGTFVLVFFGCGSVVFTTGGDPVGFDHRGDRPHLRRRRDGDGLLLRPRLGRPLQPGGLRRCRASAAGWRGARSALYVVAQLFGAILGACVLFALMQGFEGFEAEGNMGQNFFGDQGPGDYAWWAAFLLELVMTAVFVTVILAVTDERNEHPSLAPLTIGFTLAAIHFVAIPRDRHLGQPGPLDRAGALRRHRRDRPAVALHPGAARRAP